MEQFEGLNSNKKNNLFKNVRKRDIDIMHNKKFFSRKFVSRIQQEKMLFGIINFIYRGIICIIMAIGLYLITEYIGDEGEMIFSMLLTCFIALFYNSFVLDFSLKCYKSWKNSTNDSHKAKQKGNQNIKFSLLDSELGPYLQIFYGSEAYYNKTMDVRGNEIFLLNNHEFNNVEIFLERPEIVIGVGKRSVFNETEQYFIDIINRETQKVKRLFVQELNYMYNTINEIIVSRKNQDQFDIVHLDINTLEENKIIHEESVAFFKIIYNKTSNTWGKLYYQKQNNKMGFFRIDELKIIDNNFVFESFDKETYLINSQYNVLNI